MTARYAAVVAGGGPAGCAAALALARAGRRVLLVDAAPSAPALGEALPPVGRALLGELGLLDGFLRQAHAPSHGNVSAWGSGAPEMHDFLSGVHGHGWHLDRARFDAGLRAAAHEAGADVLSPARVAGAVRAGEGWRVRLDGAGEGREVACGWMVDATGRSAALARRHGGARVRHDRLVAVHARFRPLDGADRDGRTLVEAVPDGWWYTARLPSGERVAACLADAGAAGPNRLLAPAAFTAALARTTHVRAALAGYALASAPRGADAGSARLASPVGNGWIAAGDAAVSFDPLSSHGILNALHTGSLAGGAVHAHLAGDAGAMAAYARHVDAVYAAYLRHLHAYYAMEQRWPDRPFWAARHRTGPQAAEPASTSVRTGT
ncbi:MAG TPA: tryptophan 7-halogenase [Longimicrobium sp.]|nr:tryptophan 7-halogenase [Longimicrobium sp.]